MWSVSDDAKRRLGWLPVGSEASYWATLDGKDPRPSHWNGASRMTWRQYLDLAIRLRHDEVEGRRGSGDGLEQRHLRAHEMELARTTGESISANLQALLQTVGDWRTFRPRREWGPLSLPDG